MRGWLWVTALILTVAAAGWQRRTGPSYPVRIAIPLADSALAVTLPRSSPTTSAPRITVPVRAGAGVLRWRRYPTDEPFAALPLRPDADHLVAGLPIQPPAGKVEYFLELETAAGTLRAPATTVILRFHGPVPAPVLVAHIAVMFLALLTGVRAALAAALATGEERALTLVTLAGLTLGGLVLGPITQAYAFGAWWTGVPFGWDLTDNKTLVMWIGWAMAAVVAARRPRALRGAVIAAAILMLAVYVIPHSVRGSQLDYTRLPKATDVRQPARGTGRVVVRRKPGADHQPSVPGTA
jgi:hypothetical protein